MRDDHRRRVGTTSVDMIGGKSMLDARPTFHDRTYESTWLSIPLRLAQAPHQAARHMLRWRELGETDVHHYVHFQWLGPMLLPWTRRRHGGRCVGKRGPRHPYANLPLGATSTLRLHKISCSGDQDLWNDQASVPQAVAQEFGVQAGGSIVDLALNFVRRPPRTLHKLTASLACSAIQLASISIRWLFDDCSPKLAGIAAGGELAWAMVGFEDCRDHLQT
ncbi:hypothetical protein ARMGADRAFT_479271 [Armillaria gallica]|uniref:Uncharacterized protein n=1 Tax=Armillaria gallica TaxID=47427 RepID=A0A2H3CUM7_ARMGA|nr:hypothetical protein ARMGADRAFT_479271 [Armillaria gallica]